MSHMSAECAGTRSIRITPNWLGMSQNCEKADYMLTWIFRCTSSHICENAVHVHLFALQ